jgi:excisionase family DNA binding protein
MNSFYTTHEAARLLGVSLPTVVNWIKARTLRCHRTPGGHRRIAREELASFMLRQAMALPPELADAVAPRQRALVVGELGPAREGLVSQLSQLGLAAEVASPGFSAGAAMARFEPHVVVLLATRADGGETLAALRADREAGTTPVLAVGHAEWKASLLAAGATRALARPLLAGTLGEALQALASASAGGVLGRATARATARAEAKGSGTARPAARRGARAVKPGKASADAEG